MTSEIRSLMDRFLDEYLAMNPVLASHLGLEDHDEELSDSSPEGHQKALAFLKDARAHVSPLRQNGHRDLSPDDAVDAEAMLQTLEEQIFEAEELPFDHSFPRASIEASTALYTVFSRDHEPMESRLPKLTARMEKIPRLLSASKPLITDPVEIWVTTAMASAATLPLFIDTITEAGRQSAGAAALEKAAMKAKEAVEDYQKWLKNDLLPRTRTDFAIGKEKFAHLLDLRKLGFTADELIELGHYYLKETRSRLEEAARRIDGQASFDEIRERVRSDYPRSFEETLSFCREAMEKSRRYVIESGFADVPPGEELQVIETPPTFRPTTPLAAYIPPGKFAKRQRGVYMVTRNDDPEAMKDFSFTGLFNKSSHEGYPGHHLQFVCNNMHPSRLRVFHSCTEFVEGWAHYCEDYMAVNAFPDYRDLHFTMNLELIWKACRIIIDVKLSSGEMTMEEAIDMLMKEASFTRGPATGEVRRYTYTPCYQLSYLVGKHLIMEMKKDLKARNPEHFSDQAFHNALLYSGNLPLNIKRKVLEQCCCQPVSGSC